MSGRRGTGLPRPSTTRFILLILTTCAGASFATYWWLVAERGFWLTEQTACLTWLSVPNAGIAGVSGFNRCVADLALRQEGVILLGPLTITVVSVLATAILVVVLLWLYRLGVPRPTVARCFESCLRESGLRRRPRLATARHGTGGAARVVGLYPRYWVLVDGPNATAAKDDRLAVTFRHELAHLRAGDVDRALIARSAWALFFAVVAPALTISIARQGGSAWLQLGSRLLVLLVLIHLTYRSLLRAREHEADIAADAAQARSRPAPGTATMASMVAERAQKDLARPRARLGLRIPAFLLAHPAPADRISVLRDPRLAARLSVAEFLSTGIAVGLIFQELAFAVDAALRVSLDVAYWITGAITGIPVCLVAITAIWRHELAGPGALRHRTVLLAGALLGLGLLAGTQLSPRAAVDWGSVQLAVPSTLPSDLSLTSASPLTDAVLAITVIVGGALFMLWATALARTLAPGQRDSPARWQYRLGVALAVLVLAIPLGTWFMLCLVAADARIDPAAVLAADVLQLQRLFDGLSATAAVVFLSLLAAWIWRRDRVSGLFRRTVALSCAVAVMPFAALTGGAFIQRWFTAPPVPIASYHGATLPLVPPSVADSTSPLGTGITCWVFAQVPVSELTDPDTLALIGDFLLRTPDPPLRLLGGEFIRAALDPPSQSTNDLIASAWFAAGARCDALPS